MAQADVQAITERLVGRLNTVRRDQASSPEEERRDAFRGALRQELDQLDDGQQQRVLDAVRERFVQEARDRDRQVGELDSRVAELQAQVEALGARNRQLEEQISQQAAAPAPVAATPDVPGGLNKLREAMRAQTGGKKVTAAEIGLPASDDSLLRMIQEVLDFAMKYEMGINLILSELRVGGRGDLDTKMMQGLQQRFPERLRDSLDNKEGSIEELQRLLARNSKFVIELKDAFRGSIADGTRAILRQVDPQPRAEKHKRMIGTDYEAVCTELTREHEDLAGLSGSQLFDRYFFESFRAKLTDYLE